MRRGVFLILVCFINTACFFLPDGGDLPDSYPYDPSRANAEIISSHDMSEYFGLDERVKFVFSNDVLYFVLNEQVLVFNSDFTRIGEFNFNIGSIVDASPYTLPLRMRFFST